MTKVEKNLRRDLVGEGFDAGRRELEADLPFAGDASAICFGGIEFPAADSLQSEVGEILAGAGIVEVSLGYVPGRIHMGDHAHAHFARNRGQGFFRNVGKNLIQYFTFS